MDSHTKSTGKVGRSEAQTLRLQEGKRRGSWNDLLPEFRFQRWSIINSSSKNFCSTNERKVVPEGYDERYPLMHLRTVPQVSKTYHLTHRVGRHPHQDRY